MDEDDELYYYRNDYWDEADDARRNRRRPPPRRPMPGQRVTATAMAPWQRPPMAAPVVIAQTTKPGIRDMPTGLLAEVATQVFVAFFQPLPQPPPPMTGDPKDDLNNLAAYQTALAQYAKRNEQVRTVGALARLFV